MARHFSEWLYIPKLDLLAFAPAKGGSQSLYWAILKLYGKPDPGIPRLARIRQTLPEVELVSVEAAKTHPCKNRVQFVRHPKARFESLWKDKARVGFKGLCGSPANVQQQIKTLRDRHWVHQFLHRIPDSRIVVVERMPDFIPTAEHVHKSPDMKVPPYDVEDLLEYYADDVALWEEAEK